MMKQKKMLLTSLCFVAFFALCANAAPQGTQASMVAVPMPACFCPASANVINGTNASDTIAGTAADDCIIARGGNDTVTGNAGDDVMCGGRGSDNLTGDSGNDIANGGPGVDFCTAEVTISCP